jgi:plasmid replication initiation protein
MTNTLCLIVIAVVLVLLASWMLYARLSGRRERALAELVAGHGGRDDVLTIACRVGAADGPRRARRIAEPALEPEQLVLPGG